MPRIRVYSLFEAHLIGTLAVFGLVAVGEVSAQSPVASFSPGSLVFSGQQVATTSAIQTVTLTNTGGASLSIIGISITGTNSSDFAPQTNNCPGALAVNASCQINVKLTPSMLGARTAAITFKNNAANTPQTVPLSGTGTGPPPVASLSPGSVGFGNQQVATTSAIQTVTLTNTGGTPLSIIGISITGTNSSDFAPQANNCPGALAANASCQINVKFTPSMLGGRTAAITLTNSAGNSPQTVPLTGTGTGTPPVASLSPGSVGFGNQQVATTSAIQTVTLTNTGGTPLSIIGISITGTNSSDFAPQANNCPGALAANASCQINVKFTPSMLGGRTAAITLTNSAGNSPQTVLLTGTGTGTPPVASLSSGSVSFGNQQVATTSPTQTVTLTNTGGTPLSVIGISITGTNSSDFAPQANNCPGTLAVNASCQVNVKFTPATSGTRTASITLTNSASNSPQNVSLSGTGTGTPAATLSVTNLNFDNQPVGATSPAQSVTLSNSGTAPLNITSIVAGGDYDQTNTCNSVLAAGANCSISVTLTATGTGSRQSSVKITDNASGSPRFVGLAGIGTGTSAVSLAPASLTFGNRLVGTSSTPQIVTMTNNGGVGLDLVSIVASGDYAQTNNCGSGLAPGANCTISLVFTPSAAATRAGYLTINDTDITALQSVALSGQGLAPNTTVSVTPQVASLTFTQTQQFQASISGMPSSNVSWSVDQVPGGNASVGTISGSGLYTPPGTAGPHTVTATSKADSTQVAVVPVTVTDYPGTFTYHNDTALTGQNLTETVLTTGNVNSAQFGKLFSYPVDGKTYAQPLYIENLNLPNSGFHNVVYVATENDSVYAFDADGLANSPLWQASFINPAAGITTLSNNDVGCPDLQGEIGITGTPVIDPVRHLVYVIARTKETVGNSVSYVQKLHALDITTGAESPNSPVVIQASVPGSGTGTDGNGNISFDPLYGNQRAGLLLLNGVVYVAWGSLCDVGPYHGWIIGFDATTLQQVATYNASPNGNEGGIWQSGAALSADQNGNIFFETGNGTFDANISGIDYGDSFVKLSSNSGLATLDFFTPYNQKSLQLSNTDLGSGGTVLLPDQPVSPTHLLVGGSKEGRIYLLNRDSLGQYNSVADTQIVQSLPNALPQGLRGVPAYWQSQLYFQGTGDVLKAFRLHKGLLSQMPISSQSKVYLYPGAVPAISALAATNGIVWMIEYSNGSPGVLHAYDAADVSRELWNSSLGGTSDRAGIAAKFVIPTVANGKVYVGTATELDVYGLLP